MLRLHFTPPALRATGAFSRELTALLVNLPTEPANLLSEKLIITEAQAVLNHTFSTDFENKREA